MDSLGQCKHNPLARIIREEIARRGVITFARYMELALYHPDHGYYCQSRIGRFGDFYTSVSVGPLFGQLIGFALKRMLETLPGPVQIVEAGANDGALARDILKYLRADFPEFAARVSYWIIEPLAEARKRQESTLEGFGVQWFTSLDDLPNVTGAFISNELLDAFPVHVFRWHANQKIWREAGVDGDLKWAVMPPPIQSWAREPLSELKPLEAFLPDQFTVEFSFAMESWWEKAARKLDVGYLIAMDYGDISTKLWTPDRANGTLRSYFEHQLVSDVLANPGEQDITASVNFSRIQSVGERAGLLSFRLQTQEEFLTSQAAELWPASGMPSEQVRQFQTLTHPDHLGRAFKVFIQSRQPLSQ